MLIGVLGALMAWPCGVSRGDSFVSLPDIDYSDDARLVQDDPYPDPRVNAIIYPVLGFPSLVPPGGSIDVLVAFADGGATRDWRARLVSAQDPLPHSLDLVLASSSFDAVSDTYTLTVEVPAEAPRDTYDLVVEAPTLPGGSDLQRNAVKVIEAGRRDFLVVHIADSQIQDHRALVGPDVLARYFEEIRLLNPDVVLFSGDLNYGRDYVTEYPFNYRLFRDTGIAMFLSPGNHDGAATVMPVGPSPADDPPGRLQRDGLFYWRQYFGPTHFSFRYAGFRFICLNSFDGSAKRRNGVSVVVANFGGHIDPAQLNWFEAESRAATAAGEQVIPFCHHDPRGPISPNSDAYPIPRPASLGQQWNDLFSSVEVQRIVAETNTPVVLLGHIHRDDFDEEVVHPGTPDQRTVRWIRTTTMAVGSQSRLGYRIIDVQGNRMTRFNYAGLSQQSVPLGFGTNLSAVFSGPNDGTGERLTATVGNRLLREVTLSLELCVQSQPRGLKVTVAPGLTAVLREVAETDTGAFKAFVEVTIPPASTGLALTVEPDFSGAGALPPGFSGGGSTQPGSSAGSSQTAGRSGGGGGCQLAAVPEAPALAWAGVLPWALLLITLVVIRSRD